MTLELVIVLISSAELLLFTPLVWRLKRFLSAAGLIMYGITYGWLLGNHPSWLGVCLLAITAYRGFNLLRIVQNRIHDRYLRHVTFRTSLSLLLLSVLAVALFSSIDLLRPSPAILWFLLASCQLVTGIILAAYVQRGRGRSAVKMPQLHAADRDMPSITVAIPARNETETLEACLRSLIASNYPKLEILVLDDASHDRTPEIIRGFAHDGVRFIKGNTPPANWLAKNWAYKRLLEEASSDLIVFMGVDVRLEPDSLRQLVLTMNTRNLDMLSCLPLNSAQRLRGRQTTLIQPLRYAWEFIISQLPHGRPAVLSSCWVARRELLTKAGGFAAVQRAVLPEIHFARAAGERYQFVQGGKLFGISSNKPSQSQLATAIRTRYPQLHRRPESVLLLSSLQLVGLLTVYAVAIVSFYQQAWVTLSLALLTTAILHDSYYELVKMTYGLGLRRAWFSFPLAVITDITLRHISMWRYEFGQVIWKERDITAPVMHVEPRLSKL